MNSARYAVLAGLATLGVACGSVVEQESSSGSSVGAGGAGGASTTGSVTASSSSGVTASTSSGVTASSSGASGGCDQPPPQACPKTAQCVTSTFGCWCGDSPASWYCSTADPPSTLPAIAPVEGACCEEDGMFCGGFEPCGPICHCDGGAWSCKNPVECPPFACPSPVESLAGEACPTLVGETCEGTGFCHFTCICKLDPATGSAAWECSIPPC